MHPTEPNSTPDPGHRPSIDGHDPAELIQAAVEAAQSSAARTPPGRWEPPLPDEVSAMLPGYEVTGILGRGGMGAVYRGIQLSLEREVAIKLLPPELGADPEFEARFRREAKSMARLNHPNIVQIYDFGQTGEGHHYFVMEHIDGTDLHRLIHAGQLDPEGALNAIGQICDALEYAHSEGFVHRDIKPANIFLNSKGILKVGDFGLAKLVEGAAAPLSSTEQFGGLTMTGVAMGTPHYIAPEQLLGDGVDRRADIYSLGVMFYEMLTGEIPRGAVKPPSQKARLKALDVRIDDVVFKAMESDPAERYQTAFELRTDVDHIRATPTPTAEETAPATPPPAVIAPPKKAAPQKTKAPLYTGLGLAAAVAVGLAAVLATRPAEPPQAAATAAATDQSTPSDLSDSSAQTPPIERNASTPPAPSASPEKPAPKAQPPIAETPAVAPAPKPAAPPSAAAPASSQPFPPGQWVKVFTKPEDLPAHMQKPDSGITWVDGWLTPERGMGIESRSLRNLRLANVGFRLRVRRDSSELGKYTELKVRVVEGTDSCVLNSHSTGAIRLLSVGRNDDGTVRFVEVPTIRDHSAAQVSNGKEVLLELFAIGDRLYGRENGVLIKVGSAPTMQPGGILLFVSQPIRDIEVINLDGLAEAEALKILGVDESGNDLLTLTKQQEPQRPEEPKQTDTLASVPELKTLHDQFLQLRTERVAAPFEADLAKLDASYLGGLDRKIADEKAAGNLDGVLALEAEQQRVRSGQPLPADDSGTTPALVELRGIYRGAHAKLEAQRTANLQALTDPLDKRLRQMEADLTKADRLADAKTVRSYRENFQSGQSDLSASSAAADATTANLPPATKEQPFENSLGMKFVPVPGTHILMCIHETRRQDYAAYDSAVPGVDATWKAPRAFSNNLPTDGNHPVSLVSWEDANAFCQWLSKKEGRAYRLPTEREWNLAVAWDLDQPEAIGEEELDELLSKQYPWGSLNPELAGNYQGTKDGFSTTAPVGSLQPNALGLHDLGGNVWEWTGTSSGGDTVMRGCCYANFGPYRKSSTKAKAPADFRVPPDTDSTRRVVGFRLILASGTDQPSSPAQASQPTPPPASVAPPVQTTDNPLRATKEQPFENGLGMKFVPVQGTDVLFCIHETRWKDYEAYAKENPGIDDSWRDQVADGFTVTDRNADHPVWKVNWNDAKAFCEWISRKERRTYRLPTDEEWSIAVGLGRKERRTSKDTPESLSGKVEGEYPWGSEWPPPAGAGNLSDQSRKEKAPSKDSKAGYFEGYDDNFPTSAPVMSFAPNRFGLHDMEGNLREWVEDWFDASQERRTLRGGSWDYHTEGVLRSSDRRSDPIPGRRGGNNGFRLVLETQ